MWAAQEAQQCPDEPAGVDTSLPAGPWQGQYPASMGSQYPANPGAAAKAASPGIEGLSTEEEMAAL